MIGGEKRSKGVVMDGLHTLMVTSRVVVVTTPWAKLFVGGYRTSHHARETFLVKKWQGRIMTDNQPPTCMYLKLTLSTPALGVGTMKSLTNIQMHTSDLSCLGRGIDQSGAQGLVIKETSERKRGDETD